MLVVPDDTPAESRKVGFLIKPPVEEEVAPKPNKRRRLPGIVSRTITVTLGAMTIDP